MNRAAWMIVLLLAGWVELARSNADDKPTPRYEVETTLDIAYRNDKEADPIRHKLDIYLPKGQKDFPVLMFVHGGSWRSGNKSLYAALGKTFAEQGIGVVLINYRLSVADGKVKHPDHINDVASAFAWVHANIGKYGGNKDRIFISGHSAGGHLVALLGTDESYLKAHQLKLSDIHGVLALSGVYDIRPEIVVFKSAFGSDEKVCKAASPIHNVKEHLPPFLVVYAAKDFPSLDVMAEKFNAKLKEYKCESTLVKIEMRDHISIIIKAATDSTDPCTSAMLDFIAKHSEWKRK